MSLLLVAAPVGSKRTNFLSSGVSPPPNQIPNGRVGGMGQPHKGDRVLIQGRPLRPVWEDGLARAAAAGLPVSQYLADLLAIHVGRPDLVAKLGRDEEGLPLAM